MKSTLNYAVMQCIVLHTINRPDLGYNKHLVLPYPHDRRLSGATSWSCQAWGRARPSRSLPSSSPKARGHALIQSKKPEVIDLLVHRTSLMNTAAWELRRLLPE